MEPSLSELLLPGLKLMLIGMAIVYLFLALLVWIIGVTARLVGTMSPAPIQNTKRSSLEVEKEEAELVAVIAAAVERQSRPLN
jgi:oxaloacetate decarboxylase gamma subunit